MASRKRRQHDRISTRLSFEPLESRCLLSADSTVVFNEIMYHPAGDQALEWIELHNQMAVDMDLSGWQFDGALQFEFSEGTRLAGGGYLVVAAAPDQLQTVTGFAGALGPFLGHLSNGGEEIIRLDNSDRLMDFVEYDDQGPWPAAADGSGVSLAKTDPDTASGPAENWTFSTEVGGTPGARNFPDFFTPPETSVVVEIDDTWSYEASATDLGAAWRTTEYDDGGWGVDRAPFFAEEAGRKAKVQDTVSARITADNFFALYLGDANGTNLRQIGRDSITDWTSLEYFSNIEVMPNDYAYLAAWEAPGSNGGPQMLIGEFDLPDDTKLGTSMADWEYVLGPAGATPGGLLSDPPPPIGTLQTIINNAHSASS